jgi:hypothetical protein
MLLAPPNQLGVDISGPSEGTICFHGNLPLYILPKNI